MTSVDGIDTARGVVLASVSRESTNEAPPSTGQTAYVGGGAMVMKIVVKNHQWKFPNTAPIGSGSRC